MRLTLNFADISEPSQVSPGRYVMMVTEASFQEAKSADKYPQIVIKTRLDVPPSDPNAAFTRTSYISLSPKAMWKVKEVFEAVLQRPFTTEDEQIELDELIGKYVECDLDMVVNKLTNKSYLNVVKWSPYVETF